MSNVDQILTHNQAFVENKEYESYLTDKYPDKKMVILTCMDTRLVELLPKAMNLRNGDAKIIKNAGAIITHPFGNIMRSILVAIHALEAEEVFVVGHYECGMVGINAQKIVEKIKLSGVQPHTMSTLANAGIDVLRWLEGFNSVREGVDTSVDIIRKHPLMPPATLVHGMIIHPRTGKLELVNDGYAYNQSL
ncbi:carbonic anhydrase [Paenibacillus swuensis]|uniref:carbonic anhydrase n=1 Tax=Paenibacillus swuensis TaxID=1178515 RepID=A0A172TLW1_9BACL|nr:carbonic anhydrase [Paenibacillus swuensis]ANE47894.1 carbonic anhydrase [Paenibacillus swuensis]